MEAVRARLPAGVPEPARRDPAVPPADARATWSGIVDIQLGRLQQAAGRPQDRRSSSTTTAQAWLADAGYDPVYGARPLKRVIQRELQNPLATLMLEGRIADGQKVEVSAGEQGLVIDGIPAGTHDSRLRGLRRHGIVLGQPADRPLSRCWPRLRPASVLLRRSDRWPNATRRYSVTC